MSCRGQVSTTSSTHSEASVIVISVVWRQQSCQRWWWWSLERRAHIVALTSDCSEPGPSITDNVAAPGDCHQRQQCSWFNYNISSISFNIVPPVLPKDHVYRMWKVKYSNIWPNQTIVSDQSELTILLCQPMNSLLSNEDNLAMVQWPSTITILFIYMILVNTIHTTSNFSTSQVLHSGG